MLNQKTHLLSKINGILSGFSLIARRAQDLDIAPSIPPAFANRDDVVNVTLAPHGSITICAFSLLRHDNFLNITGRVLLKRASFQGSVVYSVLAAFIWISNNPIHIDGPDFGGIGEVSLAMRDFYFFLVPFVILLLPATFGRHCSFWVFFLPFRPGNRDTGPVRLVPRAHVGIAPQSLGFLSEDLYGLVSHVGRSLVRMIRSAVSPARGSSVLHYATSCL